MDKEHTVIFEPEELQQLYTAGAVRQLLAPKWNAYYADFVAGQPANWMPNQQAKELWCISHWLTDELIELKCPDEERRFVQNYFNRKARSENDLYELAAKAVNSFLENKIERYRGK